MMRTPAILFLDNADMRLGFGPGDVVPIDGAGEIAGQVRNLLKERRHLNAPLLLAVPSDWCMTAKVATDGLPRSNRRQALVYRLEEQLPVSAEDLAVDTMPIDDGHVFAIAMETGRLAPLITELEAADVTVQSIVPTALLAWHGLPNTDADVLVMVGGSSVDLLELAGNTVTGWHVVPATPEDISTYLAAISQRRETPLQVRLIGEAMTTLIDETAPWCASLPSTEATPDELALRGDLSANALPVDLRQDALRPTEVLRQLRRPLTITAAAAVLAFVAVCGISLYRGHQYATVADAAYREQVKLYQELFPGQSVPSAIRLRLSSEERRLSATRGEAGEVPPSPQTLLLLHTLLAHLPEEPAYVINELRVADGEVSIAGTVKQQADADAVVAALRGAEPLTVSDPVTKPQGPDAVSFSITASAPVAVAKRGAP